MSNELLNKESMLYGFEESKQEDIVIPRIKVINALSPERVDGLAVEGDVINSLTKEKVNDQLFIPIKQYYSNIRWNPDRNDDIRIECYSRDGRIGITNAGDTLICAECRANQFDNTKQGKEAQPLCTSYLNFLGFFEEEVMPSVLSFSKTNYNEGKKMLSIAKSMRKSIWNYGYKLSGQKVVKDKNQWFIITAKMGGETSPEARELALELYKIYEKTVLDVDYEDVATKDSAQVTDAVSAEMESEI